VKFWRRFRPAPFRRLGEFLAWPWRTPDPAQPTTDELGRDPAQDPVGSFGETGEPSIMLEPLIAPPPGTTAAYVVTETWVTRFEEISGLFLDLLCPRGDELTEDTTVSAMALFTMLPPDPNTGDPRVQVRALPIKPHTDTALRARPWRATYRLADGEAHWQTGDLLPGPYRSLVRPDWMASWTLCLPEQLPQHPIAPGATWPARSTVSGARAFWFDSDLVPVGSFVGWVDIPEEAPGAAAHVQEAKLVTAFMTEEVDNGIRADVGYEARIGSDFWLIPKRFPYRASLYHQASVVVAVDEDTGAPPGIEGRFHGHVLCNRSITRLVDPVRMTGWLV